MSRLRARWQAAVIAGAVAALGLAACGGGDAGSSDSGLAASEQATTPEAQGSEPGTGTEGRNSAIPEVSVLDVASGEQFALGSVVPSDLPVLVWFWAPH